MLSWKNTQVIFQWLILDMQSQDQRSLGEGAETRGIYRIGGASAAITGDRLFLRTRIPSILSSPILAIDIVLFGAWVHPDFMETIQNLERRHVPN
jgi:hypothetical protein